MKSATSWHGLSSLERELRWSIFTAPITKFCLEEKIHGETDLEKFFDDVENATIASSSSLVWKREGLRILDDDEDEEEIERGEFEEERSVETLVRKRKLELDEEAGLMQDNSTPRPRISKDLLKPDSERLGRQEQVSDVVAVTKKLRQEPQIDSDDLMFGGFSATSALHKFMATRGKVVSQTAESTSTERRPSDQRTDSHNFTLPVRSRESSVDQIQIKASSKKPDLQDGQQEIPTLLPQPPPVPTHLPSASFILSTSFLPLRSLTRQIERLYPSADILYRDYTLPQCPSPEADIIISPSTGLIHTTLQLIKQRPLPGQPSRSPIKERMTALRQRYERLVVLISEGLGRDMEERGETRPEDSTDKQALSDLELFADKLEGDVLVTYIHGGEYALACGIVCEMARYGLEHGSRDIGDIKPLAVETTVSLLICTWLEMQRRLQTTVMQRDILIHICQKLTDQST